MTNNNKTIKKININLINIFFYLVRRTVVQRKSLEDTGTQIPNCQFSHLKLLLKAVMFDETYATLISRMISACDCIPHN